MKTPTTPQRPKQDSWLSLVAETAGVGDCSVARVELFRRGRGGGEQRVIIQVLAASGAVLGAATWSGSSAELSRGVAVDLGYFSLSAASRVMAWVDPSDVGADPFFSAATGDAVSELLDGVRTPRLVLRDAVGAAA